MSIDVLIQYSFHQMVYSVPLKKQPIFIQSCTIEPLSYFKIMFLLLENLLRWGHPGKSVFSEKRTSRDTMALRTRIGPLGWNGAQRTRKSNQKTEVDGGCQGLQGGGSGKLIFSGHSFSYARKSCRDLLYNTVLIVNNSVLYTQKLVKRVNLMLCMFF